MKPALPLVVEALALRAEKDGAPQPVPPRMLREIAEALKDLSYVGQHGEAWSQRIARDGRQAASSENAEGGDTVMSAADLLMAHRYAQHSRTSGVTAMSGSAATRRVLEERARSCDPHKQARRATSLPQRHIQFEFGTTSLLRTSQHQEPRSNP